MLVICKVCQGKGRIATSDRLSSEFTRLYCHFMDPCCGHTWVTNLTFSHTLSPTDPRLAPHLRQPLHDERRRHPDPTTRTRPRHPGHDAEIRPLQPGAFG